MERISKERTLWPCGARSGAWQYVVKGPGLALEVLVAWTPESGCWRMVAGVRHQLLCPPMPGDEVAEEKCELVGGACELEGLSLQVLDAFETYGEPRSSSTERPEPFWQALERIAMGQPV